MSKPSCWPIAALPLLAVTTFAQDNPFEQEARKSYVGRFKSAKGEVVLRNVGDGAYEGQASFLGKTLPLAGSLQSGELRGQLGSGKDRFPFTCTFDSADKLRFKAGSFSSVLERVPAKDLSGNWGNKRVKLGLRRSQKGDYAGTVTLKGKSFRLVGRQDATGLLKGVFESGGRRFPFSVREYSGGVEFKTGSFKAVLRAQRYSLAQTVEMAKKARVLQVLKLEEFERPVLEPMIDNVVKAREAIRTKREAFLESVLEKADEESVKAALATFRKEREAARAALKKAQGALLECLNPKQEAICVALGLLE